MVLVGIWFIVVIDSDSGLWVVLFLISMMLCVLVSVKKFLVKVLI